MNRDEIINLLTSSKIFSEWHWFYYHFKIATSGHYHPLAESVINACLVCETRIQGFTKQFINRIASISGKEKHLPDWEQLLQQLAELHVLAQIAAWDWPEDTVFEQEPTAGNSDKNPELVVRAPSFTFGIEVKAPAIFQHWENRSSNPVQIASRFATREITDKLTIGQAATYPRDNPVKDYLISANEKFDEFVRQDRDFVGVLVILWDDFIFEPISALVQEDSGLLTENSFYKDGDENAVKFQNVSCVIVLRHLIQLIRACRDEPLTDGIKHALDDGPKNSFPWKALIPNPHANTSINEVVKDCLDAIEITPEMGAEYQPQEFITWLNN